MCSPRNRESGFGGEAHVGLGLGGEAHVAKLHERRGGVSFSAEVTLCQDHTQREGHKPSDAPRKVKVSWTSKEERKYMTSSKEGRGAGTENVESVAMVGVLRVRVRVRVSAFGLRFQWRSRIGLGCAIGRVGT